MFYTVEVELLNTNNTPSCIEQMVVSAGNRQDAEVEALYIASILYGKVYQEMSILSISEGHPPHISGIRLEEHIGALHDTVHHEVGKSRVAKTTKVKLKH